jgi:plasmid stabilization system protein ParE
MKPALYETLERIAAVINERQGGDAAKSYVARLLAEARMRPQESRRGSDRGDSRRQVG